MLADKIERRYCGVPLGVESAGWPAAITLSAGGARTRAMHTGMKWLVACLLLVLGLAGELGAQPAAAPPTTMTDLVAPIAVYPDVLLAQVLAASTHPDEIVKAEAWLDGKRPWHPRELAQEVDGNPWHPEIKALALIRPVLHQMQGNLASTAALGEAYERNPAEVLRAVQAVRQKAQAAGELASASGQRIIVKGATIMLEPLDPEFVYVPGAGVFDVSATESFAWGWHAWQVSWKEGDIRHQDAPYRSSH